MSKGIRKHKPSLSQVAAIWLLPLLSSSYTRKNAQVVTGLQTSCLQICSQAVDKLCSHCLFLIVVTSLE